LKTGIKQLKRREVFKSRWMTLYEDEMGVLSWWSSIAIRLVRGFGSFRKGHGRLKRVLIQRMWRAVSWKRKPGCWRGD